MFFERGEPPNDRDKQVDAASKAGLDAVKAKAVLDDQAAYADVTRSKLEAARREGVSGVPCFRIDGVEVATGAQGVDLWEHKPELEKRDGEPLPGEEDFLSFQGKNGNLMRSPWPFVASGESGKKISSMLPHMQQHIDRIAFVHSLSSKSNTHGPGCIFMNTGHVAEGCGP